MLIAIDFAKEFGFDVVMVGQAKVSRLLIC